MESYFFCINNSLIIEWNTLRIGVGTPIRNGIGANK